jgi:hypothetical protein
MYRPRVPGIEVGRSKEKKKQRRIVFDQSPSGSSSIQTELVIQVRTTPPYNPNSLKYHSNVRERV